jgi:hypothetical protein
MRQPGCACSLRATARPVGRCSFRAWLRRGQAFRPPTCRAPLSVLRGQRAARAGCPSRQRSSRSLAPRRDSQAGAPRRTPVRGAPPRRASKSPVPERGLGAAPRERPPALGARTLLAAGRDHLGALPEPHHQAQPDRARCRDHRRELARVPGRRRLLLGDLDPQRRETRRPLQLRFANPPPQIRQARKLGDRGGDLLGVEERQRLYERRARVLVLHRLGDQPMRIAALGRERAAHQLADGGGIDARSAHLQILHEVVAEGLRGREAIVRIRAQRLIADRCEDPIHVRHDRSDARFIASHARTNGLGRRLLLREPAAGDRLPQHDPDREHIGAAVDRAPQDLFGRGVGKLALEDAGLGRALAVRCLGHAEIHQLHLPVIGDEHILRADVAVHDVQGRAVEVPQLVRVVQPGQHLAEDVQVDVQRQPARGTHTVEKHAERLAIQVLHREKVPVAFLIHLERLHDVRVLEPRSESRLVHEHRHEALFARQLLSQLLDHEQLAELPESHREREMDRAHPALAKRRHQPVLAELIGGGGRVLGVRTRRHHVLCLACSCSRIQRLLRSTCPRT